MLHLGVMLGWGPLSRWETVTCEGKTGGRGCTTVLTFHVILSPRPCCHTMAPPCSPLELPSSGWGCVPQMAAPSVDAAGRRGRDTVSSGCCGRKLWPWVLTHSCTGMNQVISTSGLCWIGENHKKEWNKIHNLRQDKKNLNKNYLSRFWPLPSRLVHCASALCANQPSQGQKYLLHHKG